MVGTTQDYKISFTPSHRSYGWHNTGLGLPPPTDHMVGTTHRYLHPPHSSYGWHIITAG